MSHSIPRQGFLFLCTCIMIVVLAGCTNDTPPDSKLVKISGIVYERSPDTSYTLSAIPSPVLGGASVVIDGKTVNSDPTTGAYELADVSAGFHTISCSKNGYMPTIISWDFQADAIFNIGMYAQPTIVSRSGFIKGMITWDAGGWLLEYYYARNLFQPTYQKIQDRSGANLVTVPDPVYVKTATTDGVTLGTTSVARSTWRMMNQSEYTNLQTSAASHGMELMMWFGITIDSSGPTNYNDIVYASGQRSSAFWDSWFSQYQTYLVQYATIAKNAGIKYICIGHNLDYATSKSRFQSEADCNARWSSLISAVRTAAPQAKLVYFGRVDPSAPFDESADYASGFVDLFDYIGVAFQNVNPTYNPTLNQLKSSITSILNTYASFTKPLLIMIHTPSVDGGTSFSTYIEPCLAAGTEANKHDRNMFQQADLYEALFEVINGTGSGNGKVMGVLSWGYNYLDGYLTTPGQEPNDAMAMDKSANIRGKPAEAVCGYWFANL